LYRIAQEAVNNALRHSKAKDITIRLVDDTGRLMLAVIDNGRGGARTAPNGTGMGLRVMKYRADLIGASLEVESVPRKGTRVLCTMARPA
jgi:signal transduction histidine kinase